MIMGKDYLHINAGMVIFTKYDPKTGALSTNPKDKRICTETVEGITRKKTLNTYELANGNSNYPAGVYELGVAYQIGITFTTLNSETLAFLQNSTIKKGSGTIKELVQTNIPMVAPYEIEALGKIVGEPTILDSESTPFNKGSSPEELESMEYVVIPGTGDEKDKIAFSEEDAGKPITLEYVFEATEVEEYGIDKNAVNPVVQIEIIHETLSRDKTKRYKNNSIISRAQLTGDIDENLARQHAPTTLNFTAIEPIGSQVVVNRKTEIPL